MPPPRSRLAIQLSLVLFWALMVLVAVEDYRRDGGTALWRPVLWETSSAVVATGLFMLQRHFTARHDALVATPLRWFLLQARWLPLYWFVFTPVVFAVRHGVYALLGDTYDHEPWRQVLPYEAIKISLFAGLFTTIGFGLLSWRAMLDARLRAEQAGALLREARLAQLTRQMQPHFLFNALNTISSLMQSDVARADATLMQLAGVLRATLALGEKAETTLAQELEIARGYAAIMEERFAGRVTIDWDIDPTLLSTPMPAISLQPLLENVFKHTVERRRGSTAIHVSAQQADDMLVLRVDDDAGTLDADGKPGDEGEHGGIALANLRTRLDALHGGRASVALQALSPAGVRAEMRLPCAS